MVISAANSGILLGLGRVDTIPSSTSKNIVLPLGVRHLFTFRSKESTIPAILDSSGEV